MAAESTVDKHVPAQAPITWLELQTELALLGDPLAVARQEIEEVLLRGRCDPEASANDRYRLTSDRGYEAIICALERIREVAAGTRPEDTVDRALAELEALGHRDITLYAYPEPTQRRWTCSSSLGTEDWPGAEVSVLERAVWALAQERGEDQYGETAVEAVRRRVDHVRELQAAKEPVTR
jgi:hypothetical protein